MMKKALMLGSGLAVVLALTPGASSAQSKAPAAPEKMVYDAASAMEYFKGLSGDWQAGALGHEHGSSPASSYGNSLSFKTKANGSAVVQTSGAGQSGRSRRSAPEPRVSPPSRSAGSPKGLRPQVGSRSRQRCCGSPISCIATRRSPTPHGRRSRRPSICST